MNEYHFEPPSSEKIMKTVTEFYELLNRFTSVYSIDANVVSVSLDYLIEIITEVEKEKKRIAIFHNNIIISEVREISLYCYFILKKRPIVANSEFRQSNRINELFCVYLLFTVISEHHRKSGNNKGIELMPKDYLRSVLYIFSNGDLSKDALYLLALTLQTFGSREGL